MKHLSFSMWTFAVGSVVTFATQPILAQNPETRTPANRAPAAPNIAALAAAQIKLPRGISLGALSAHQIHPANLDGVTFSSYEGPRRIEIKPLTPFKTKVPKLNTIELLNNVDKALKGQVAGYAIAVQRGAIGIGKPKLLVKRDYSRRVGDGQLDWDEDTRMHIASVSKLLTAMAVSKALDEKGLTLDTKISAYLPSYWSQGANINKITFRNLLTQSSGFNTGNSGTDFAFMKAKVAAGVTTSGENAIGTYHYENMNCGLCRILLPVMMGKVVKTQDFQNVTADVKDQLWDGLTVYYYQDYMQDKVLTPSGVTDASFAPTAGEKGALAYPFPAGSKGWDSGDLASVAGGAGWRLSMRDLLDVMSTWADTDKILPKAKTLAALDAGLGLDVIADTPIGRMYSKNGLWQNGERREQCVAYFLPDNLQFAVFVNSGVGPSNAFLRSIIDKAFLDAIK